MHRNIRCGAVRWARKGSQPSVCRAPCTCAFIPAASMVRRPPDTQGGDHTVSSVLVLAPTGPARRVLRICFVPVKSNTSCPSCGGPLSALYSLVLGGISNICWITRSNSASYPVFSTFILHRSNSQRSAYSVVNWCYEVIVDGADGEEVNVSCCFTHFINAEGTWN